MDIRNKLQEEAANNYKNKGVYFMSPRFGKIRTTFLICEKQAFKNVKIIAPRVDIHKGWKDDAIKFNFDGSLSFLTTTILSKTESEEVDLYVLDEIQEYSLNQLRDVKKVIGNNKFIALTGTMTNKTLSNIQTILGMSVCFKYTIEEAVGDGILADYRLYIHEVGLDDVSNYIVTKKGRITEKKRLQQLTWLKDKLSKEGKATFFLDLKIINLLQNSLAKRNKTISLIKQYKEERILVFCGTTETADILGIPVYHSKSKEKDLFNAFCQGEGKHLATIKMMQAGITILPIKKGICNYLSGSPENSAQIICRFLGFEYDSPNKQAEIHIVCSNTEFEKSRLVTALRFFDDDKIFNVHEINNKLYEKLL